MKGGDGRFARVPLWAAKASLGSAAFRVLIALCAHLRDGAAYPSFATLAELTGIDRKNIPRALADLERAGLIRCERSPGGRTNSNRYQVFFPPPETSSGLRTFSDLTGEDVSAGNSLSGEDISAPKRPQNDPETSSGLRTKQKEQRRARTTRVRALDLFMDFWRVFPKRTDRESEYAARKAFEVALDGGADPEVILRGAAAYARSVEDIDHRRFIQSASRWLSERGWESNPPATPEAPPDPDQPRSYSGNRP